MVGFAGETEIELKFDKSTVRDAAALCGLKIAVIMFVPRA
jgi:hypothetical protein